MGLGGLMTPIELMAYLQQGEIFPNTGTISEAKFKELIENLFDEATG